MASAAGVLFEFELKVGFDVFRALFQAWQAECPQIDAGQQVFTEALFMHGLVEVAIGSGDQLEVAFAFAICAEREKCFFFQSAQEHRLFIETEFTDFIEEKDALVGGSQQSGTVLQSSCEGSFDVSEERGHCAVAA